MMIHIGDKHVLITISDFPIWCKLPYLEKIQLVLESPYPFLEPWDSLLAEILKIFPSHHRFGVYRHSPMAVKPVLGLCIDKYSLSIDNTCNVLYA